MVQQQRQPKAGWAGDDADDTDDFYTTTNNNRLGGRVKITINIPYKLKSN